MNYMWMPLERAFKDAARFGYDGMRYGRPTTCLSFDLKAEEINEIKEFSRKYDLPILDTPGAEHVSF